MRLRNITGSREMIAENEFVIHQPEQNKGKWNTVFKNTNPIHIEIGMGKGKFLHTLAQNNPGVNYLGIEKYSSVLLRAIQKMEEAPLLNLRFTADWNSKPITENSLILPWNNCPLQAGEQKPSPMTCIKTTH